MLPHFRAFAKASQAPGRPSLAADVAEVSPSLFRLLVRLSFPLGAHLPWYSGSFWGQGLCLFCSHCGMGTWSLVRVQPVLLLGSREYEC